MDASDFLANSDLSAKIIGGRMSMSSCGWRLSLIRKPNSPPVVAALLTSIRGAAFGLVFFGTLPVSTAMKRALPLFDILSQYLITMLPPISTLPLGVAVEPSFALAAGNAKR